MKLLRLFPTAYVALFSLSAESINILALILNYLIPWRCDNKLRKITPINLHLKPPASASTADAAVPRQLFNIAMTRTRCMLTT
jgi:hypothetical protein